MAKAPQSRFELAMERLRASDPAGADEKPLSEALEKAPALPSKPRSPRKKK